MKHAEANAILSKIPNLEALNIVRNPFAFIESLNRNEGAVNVLLTLALVLFTWLLWRVEARRGQAILRLRHAQLREPYRQEKKEASVYFALANVGGLASPPDPHRCYVLVPKGRSHWGMRRRWEKCSLSIYTQDHYFENEVILMRGIAQASATKDWPNVSDHKKEPSVSPGQLRQYVAKIHFQTPITGQTSAWLFVLPAHGRGCRAKFIIH